MINLHQIPFFSIMPVWCKNEEQVSSLLPGRFKYEKQYTAFQLCGENMRDSNQPTHYL